ncbi:hypothetical protein ABVT39_008231 [Epinephelus coioides]
MYDFATRNMTLMFAFPFLGQPVHESTEAGQTRSKIELNWSLSELNNFVCQSYPLVSLNLVGFELARTGKGRKIQKLKVSSVRELKQAVGKSRVYILPRAAILQEMKKQAYQAFEERRQKVLFDFVGQHEMASEIFKVQEATSSRSTESNSSGSIMDHDLKASSTLYVLWLSNQDVQVNIQEATTVQEANSAIAEAADSLSIIGALRHVSNLKEKDSLVQSAADFSLNGRMQIALDQFVEGFRTLGLLEELRENPAVFHSMFVSEERPLQAKDLFSLFGVDYSVQGSNKRAKENSTICY